MRVDYAVVGSDPHGVGILVGHPGLDGARHLAAGRGRDVEKPLHLEVVSAVCAPLGVPAVEHALRAQVYWLLDLANAEITNEPWIFARLIPVTAIIVRAPPGVLVGAGRSSGDPAPYV